MLQLQELGLASTVTNTLKLGWINNQTWTPVDLHPGRKAIAVNGYTRLRKTNMELSTASKVA